MTILPGCRVRARVAFGEILILEDVRRRAASLSAIFPAVTTAQNVRRASNAVRAKYFLIHAHKRLSARSRNHAIEKNEVARRTQSPRRGKEGLATQLFSSPGKVSIERRAAGVRALPSWVRMAQRAYESCSASMNPALLPAALIQGGCQNTYSVTSDGRESANRSTFAEVGLRPSTFKLPGTWT